MAEHSSGWRRFAIPLVWVVSGLVEAQELVRTPAQTKALYTKSIAEYTTWPDTSSQSARAAPFVIGVVGEDPNGVVEIMRVAIASEKGMSIKGRPVEVMEFPSVAANEERQRVVAALEACDVLFFSEGSREAWAKLRPMLQNRPIMTVSELQGFALQGGIVEYEYDEDAQRMYMIFNMRAVKEAGLVLSARLLGLRISKPLFEAEQR